MRNVSDVCISACQMALCFSPRRRTQMYYTVHLLYIVHHTVYTHTTELPTLLNYFPNILNWREERKFPCASIPLDKNWLESFHRVYKCIPKLQTSAQQHTHTHTQRLCYVLVSACPYHIMRLNQSWMDYLSSSFDAKSHPMQTALSLSPTRWNSNIIFIWSSDKLTHTNTQCTSAPRSVQLSAAE